VSEPWTVDNGFVTPTFKVKRNRVEEVYAAYWERWVTSGETVIWAEGSASAQPGMKLAA